MHCSWMLGLQLCANEWVSIKPLKVKLFAGEQKATKLFSWGQCKKDNPLFAMKLAQEVKANLAEKSNPTS